MGPVYTPPELRGRGHATALVAELTRRLLAGGCSTCMLYTGLSNPTSNRIYRRIGSLPVCDTIDLAFDHTA
ncbi:MAG TPA: GNAT family N-acetyltransferase [Gaiellales bacterium]|nr:GNAT family N-acetyltransferase [Gaiellales bacterium]